MAPLLLAWLVVGAVPGLPRDPAAQALVEHLSDGISARVGQWVSYRMSGTGGRVSFWKVAVVDRERDRKGRPALWVEIEMDQTPKFVSPLMQIRMLVAQGEGFDADGITRMLMAVGVGKPFEVDLSKLDLDHAPLLEGGGMPAQYDPSQTHVQKGRPRKLMTPAGTLTARPFEVRYRQTVVERLWTSDEIPVLKLAKIEFPGLEDSMEVQDYGLDAKPQMHLPPPGGEKVDLSSIRPPNPGGSDAHPQNAP